MRASAHERAQAMLTNFVTTASRPYRKAGMTVYFIDVSILKRLLAIPAQRTSEHHELVMAN